MVFWNFSLSQEKDILADLTFGGDNSLMVKPLAEEECEIEDLHFHYAPNTKRPRIYNDMIHIPSADNKMKLAMSHALAQSVKLSRFELRTDVTMNSALFYPKKLALYGHLGLSRVEVVRMSGHLFQLRVDVNLISNILDTPDFLWDSEPLLLPLYTAFREYLEIGPRTNVLNRRCKVIFDMLDIFGKSSADRKMNSITWIIIILISLFVIIFTVSFNWSFYSLTNISSLKSYCDSDGLIGNCVLLVYVDGLWSVKTNGFRQLSLFILSFSPQNISPFINL